MKGHSFAEIQDINFKSEHRSEPETAVHHVHIERKGDKVAVVNHGPKHEVLAETQFHPDEHAAMGAHIAEHLGLDDTEPDADGEKSGKAYAKEADGSKGAAGAAY